MKKILWLVVAFMLVTVLASAEDDPMGPAFGNGKIQYFAYETNGTATQKIIDPKVWLGFSRHEGWLVEWDVDGDTERRQIAGSSEFTYDHVAINLFGVHNNYYCDYWAIDYTWDSDLNKLKDTDAIVACYDRIGAGPLADPFIGPFNDCTMVLNFSVPEKFTGKIKCEAEVEVAPEVFVTTKFVGKINGTKRGKYDRLYVDPPPGPPTF